MTVTPQTPTCHHNRGCVPARTSNSVSIPSSYVFLVTPKYHPSLNKNLTVNTNTLYYAISSYIHIIFTDSRFRGHFEEIYRGDDSTPYRLSWMLKTEINGTYTTGLETPMRSPVECATMCAGLQYCEGATFDGHTCKTYLVRTWWRHQMETFSVLLAICAGNSPVPGEFPTQRPVTRSFDVYFDLRPNKWLSKQSWGWWFETLSCSLWRHRNG